MKEKPFCLHFNDRRKVLPLLRPTDKILNEHNSGWMIVHMPGMEWDFVINKFKDVASVGVCEQKEYLQEVPDKG